MARGLIPLKQEIRGGTNPTAGLRTKKGHIKIGREEELAVVVGGGKDLDQNSVTKQGERYGSTQGEGAKKSMGRENCWGLGKCPKSGLVGGKNGRSRCVPCRKARGETIGFWDAKVIVK